MSTAVDLARLAETLRDYRFAYFVTVDDDHRPRTTTVTPTYESGVFHIGTVGRHGRANLATRRRVTLVWPPREATDYSLIVDGDAEAPDDPDQPVRVRPTRALLHRPKGGHEAAPAVGPATGSAYDCVIFREDA